MSVELTSMGPESITRSAQAAPSEILQLPEQSPQTYCDSIRGYTISHVIGNSLFPGVDFDSLVSLLRLRSNRGGQPLDSSAFVTLYRFHPGGRREINPLNSVVEFDAIFSDGLPSPVTQTAMLFMAGFPSPDWIAAIGAKFQIDPSYFQGHIRLPSSLKNRTQTFSHPLLPSVETDIFRLRYVSIGERQSEREPTKQDIDQLRRATEKQMDTYYNDLGIAKLRKPGDAVVRLYHLHNERFFSIEQDISICNVDSPWGEISLVWLDSGHDLSEGPRGPWHEPKDYTSKWKSKFIPTVQYLPGIALNKWRAMTIPDEHQLRGEFDQSASLIVRNYGQSLDPTLASANSFYSLHELYSFSAHSMCQFLNLIDSIIVAETGYGSTTDKHFSHVNLLYHQDILTQQAKMLQHIIRGIEAQASRLSFSSPESHEHAPLSDACHTLLANFRELLARNERLISRCARGMDVLMNRAMIEESKRAISQAKKIEQLTWLASFYIPLSFMTSFFGMNLGNLGSEGHLPLWLWFATSIPVLILSFAGIRVLRWYFT